MATSPLKLPVGSLFLFLQSSTNKLFFLLGYSVFSSTMATNATAPSSLPKWDVKLLFEHDDDNEVTTN